MRERRVGRVPLRLYFFSLRLSFVPHFFLVRNLKAGAFTRSPLLGGLVTSSAGVLKGRRLPVPADCSFLGYDLVVTGGDVPGWPGRRGRVGEELVVVCNQSYLSRYIRPEWIMAAAGLF